MKDREGYMMVLTEQKAETGANRFEIQIVLHGWFFNREQEADADAQR
jgi:hypothetical protein